MEFLAKEMEFHRESEIKMAEKKKVSLTVYKSKS